MWIGPTFSQKTLRLALPLSFLVVGFSAGCSEEKPAEPKVEPAKKAAEPEPEPEPRHPNRPVEVTRAKVEAGQAKWITCQACHGPKGEGVEAMGPRLHSRTFLEAASDQMLTKTITGGRPGTPMVAWGSLGFTAEDIENLVALIRSWEEIAPVDLDESELGGNAEAGAKVFTDVCAACHGDKGQGYPDTAKNKENNPETAAGTGIARKDFLGEASNGYLRYIIKNGKTDTAMRAFNDGSDKAELSDEDIENVIAYLRANAI